MRQPNDYATKPSHHYAHDTHFVVEQIHAGGYKRPTEVTTMQVRRVVPSGSTEELQIEITVAKIGEKRTTTAYGSLTLTPELADELAAACAKVRGK